MLLKLLFFIIFGSILISPAMAQAPSVDQAPHLHEELREAIKSGDKQKAEQLRAQLNVLHKQQMFQRKQLWDAFHEAIKAKDKLKVHQLIEELKDQLIPNMSHNRGPSSGPWMNDPQRAALHEAVKNKDKQKADQLRTQLTALTKQRFVQRQQLFKEMQEAIKNKDNLKAHQLRDQLLNDIW